MACNGGLRLHVDPGSPHPGSAGGISCVDEDID